VQWGPSLRKARRRAGLTQRQLAERAGVPQSTVARIESGTHVPRIDTLDHLLRAAGMQLEVSHLRGVGVDHTQIAELLDLTPDERVQAGVVAARNLRDEREARGRTEP
jgi:transcriptional regulator with XRE-family HTH domain